MSLSARRGGGTDPATLDTSRHAIATRLSMVAPEEDEAMLRGAGFSVVSLFYAGLRFRGWVGYAGVELFAASTAFEVEMVIVCFWPAVDFAMLSAAFFVKPRLVKRVACAALRVATTPRPRAVRGRS